MERSLMQATHALYASEIMGRPAFQLRLRVYSPGSGVAGTLK
jgi:hypothetical protein